VKLKRPPTLESLLSSTLSNRGKPIAFVLAGHNGSGKSTLWYLRMAYRLEMPLINADRLTSSILPEPPLPEWAIKLRDQNDDWQRISQQGVRVFRELVMDQNISFAYETVFSYWKKNSDGSYASKADDIQLLQNAGYFVIVLFVGLAYVSLSRLRVLNRKRMGGHNVPVEKLEQRFSRTQKAIGHASTIADMTLMFDNSRDEHKAFGLVRAQLKDRLLFDARDPTYNIPKDLKNPANIWLTQVTGPYPQTSH
jgi:predicted ABC-type ATPase